MEVTLPRTWENEIDDINLVDNISDGFYEIPMTYPLCRKKRASCREVKQYKVTFA